MKIGIVCPYNMALGGAVQEIVKESYDELERRGHEVVILTPLPSQGKPDLPGYHIRYVGKAYDLRAIGTVAQVSVVTNASEIDGFFADEQPDILHVHEPWVPLMNSQILRRAPCPVVATFHAKLPDNAVSDMIKTLGRVYTRPGIRRVNVCVAVSEPAAEHISEVLGRQVPIIPNAVNLSQFKPPKVREPLAEHKKTILYVGRLETRKGPAHLISAFKTLHEKHPETRLLIGGKGPDMDMLRAQATIDGTGAVEFLGYLEDREKKRLMQHADLFVAPAVFGESFGIILIEALASGQVLIAGDNPGYRSVMKEFGEVSLVDPCDTPAFASKLETMLYDEKLRDDYRAWALGYVKQFDYRIITDKYVALYEQLVKEAEHVAVAA
jgi:phosphatidylinositol alpha-mannosyltransferase